MTPIDIHRYFTESQNIRDWKGPWKIILSNPPGGGILDQVPFCSSSSTSLPILFSLLVVSIPVAYYSLNVCRDQVVVWGQVVMWVAVRPSVVSFCSGNNDVKNKPHSKWPCTTITAQNEEHLDQIFSTNWVMVVIVLKNSVLKLKICSIKHCHCALCSFHGNKKQALLLEWGT